MSRRTRLAPVVLASIVAALVASPAPSGAEDPPAISSPQPGASSLPPADATELEQLLTRLDQEERALREELARISPELDVTKSRLLARARAYYRHVRAGFLPAGGGFDALVDYAATVERTRRALERDQAASADLERRQAAIHDKLARIRVMRAPLEVQREAMIRARAALQQAEERRAAFARAFETSVRPPDYMAIYGADADPADGDTSSIRGGFPSLRGRLPLPVSGRAEAMRVMRRGAGGAGLEFYAMPGATARSVASGRVAFADLYDDYGLTVILDHGDNYYTVYAGLKSVEVSVGDNAPQSFRLGIVGAPPAPLAAPPAMAPGDQRPVLYFEVRHREGTIDPSPWLGL